MIIKKLVSFFCFALVLNIVYSQDGVTVAKATFPYTVSIVMQDQYKKPLSLGSGFIIAPGKVVTNVHVVEGASYGVVIEDKTGKTFKIEGYTSIDKKNDLIILSVPTIIKTGIVLSDTVPEVGQKIFAIGNPNGLSGTISEGIISGIRNLENNDLYQITAPLSPGSSGGPVLNLRGDVIGVSVASLTSGQNLNFAVPAKYVKKLMSNDKNILVKLNIVSAPSKPNVISPKAGVFVSDIVWKTGHYDKFEQYMHSFSITNLTENSISDIHLVAIVYKNNLPIDYCEFTIFRGNYGYGNYGAEKVYGIAPIEPFLGKTLTLIDGTMYNVHFDTDELSLRFNKNTDEKMVFRILDYSISE
jgi:hypothetical protein